MISSSFTSLDCACGGVGSSFWGVVVGLFSLFPESSLLHADRMAHKATANNTFLMCRYTFVSLINKECFPCADGHQTLSCFSCTLLLSAAKLRKKIHLAYFFYHIAAFLMVCRCSFILRKQPFQWHKAVLLGACRCPFMARRSSFDRFPISHETTKRLLCAHTKG